MQPALWYLRVGLARVRQQIGWAGVGGAALMVVAAVVFGLAWNERVNHPVSAVALPADKPPRTSPQANTKQAVVALLAELPPASDVPLLLMQIKQLALGSGLPWTAADYHLTPATDGKPASLEVFTTFRAPYPAVRLFAGQVLRDVPGAALREFSLSRPSIEAVNVEARLTIAVLLRDEAP